MNLDSLHGSISEGAEVYHIELVRAALFKLYNMTTNLPAGLYLDAIDGPQCPLPSILDEIAKIVKKLDCTFVGFNGFAQFFCHRTVPSYRIRSQNCRALKMPRGVALSTTVLGCHLQRSRYPAQSPDTVRSSESTSVRAGI
jgi:hypothetical protein